MYVSVYMQNIILMMGVIFYCIEGSFHWNRKKTKCKHWQGNKKEGSEQFIKSFFTAQVPVLEALGNGALDVIVVQRFVCFIFFIIIVMSLLL